ncbi:hypothetical protein QL285_042201 [Trifolium repens]|nr:hypothetical protein QL285_042201 [Trifolium repens]
MKSKFDMSIVQENPPKTRFRMFFQSLDEWFEYKNKGECEWFNSFHNSNHDIFAYDYNPSGGVLQAGLNDVSSLNNNLCSNITGICAGEAKPSWVVCIP